jgi:type VI secretion system Hcp family effector
MQVFRQRTKRLPSTGEPMAIDAFVWFTGFKSIGHSNTHKKREKESRLVGASFGHFPEKPFHFIHAIKSRKHHHHEVRVWKVGDSASAHLHKALTDKELLKAEIHFYKPVTGGISETGEEQPKYTVQFENVQIIRIQHVAHRSKASHDSYLKHYHHVAEITFKFERFSETEITGGITFSDDWTEPTS